MNWIATALILAAVSAHATEAELEFVSGEQRLVLSQSQLLARSDVATISIPESVYRLRLTRFRAIAIASLFRGVAIPESAVIQFRATDGFAASLDKARLFSTDPNASRAYLAIEDPTHPWPHLAGKGASAGPFYLVWKNPKASAIGSEEWPYQIAAFVVVSDLRSAFPKIYPATDAAPGVQAGFRSFQKNCLPCHRMNGEGFGSAGPDLNIPMNPTEYLDERALRLLIRDPARVRTWPRRAMNGFPKAVLPDGELTDLIAYLRHMGAWRPDRAQ